MSATLYALVVLQGTTLTFSPGYTTAAECLQQYKGPLHLVAFHMTRSAPLGRRFLKPPAVASGLFLIFQMKACVRVTSARSGVMSRPPAGN